MVYSEPFFVDIHVQLTGNLSNYIRISAGKPADTDRVVAELKKIGAEKFKLCDAAVAAGQQAVRLFGYGLDHGRTYHDWNASAIAD